MVTMLTDGISRPVVIHLYRPPLSWRNGGRPYSTTDIHSQERTFTERVHPCIHFERPHRRMINCVRFTWNCGRFTLNRPRFTGNQNTRPSNICTGFDVRRLKATQHKSRLTQPTFDSSLS